MGPKTAQDAPGTTIVTSGDPQVPLILSLLRLTSTCKVLTSLTAFGAIEEGVDAAVPVDAQNAPTSDLENCRQFSTAPTPLIVCLKKKDERRGNDKNSATGSGPPFNCYPCPRTVLLPMFPAAHVGLTYWRSPAAPLTIPFNVPELSRGAVGCSAC